ncbi:MAG: CopG family transcriptional regulator [Candidatus Electrothrix sp. ATG2]|nr:CopG family transcriptional regulator [Candidatus Electrothrix sp. ATG2]
MKKEYDFSAAKRGSVIQQPGKTRITIYLDNDVLEDFRERADSSGAGYQTMINEALREYLHKKQEPISEASLRKVVREELERVALH